LKLICRCEHTHCIIFNATQDASDGRWKALHNYGMLAAQKFVENVYYHELAREPNRCGYTVETSAPGGFPNPGDLDGAVRTVLETPSRD
jgi:hypothetical protein